jgi:hypothetical protein
MNQNLTFSLHEENKEDNEISYEDLLKNIENLEETLEETLETNSDFDEIDEYTTLEINYNTNYTRKELNHIANYYSITKRKKSKQQLVVAIILFELNIENSSIVYTRKNLWEYMKEIKLDKYLSKFLILD